MKELVCIVCPKGCRLRVDDENGFTVTGNTCPRGAEYGKNEIMNPCRVLTSTVRIENAMYRRCPVRTSKAIPRGLLSEAMKLLDNVDLVSPVKRGQTVIENILGTGVDIIATKDM